MALVPELFADGCDHKLPVGPVVDHYEVAQLLPLSARLGELDLPVLINPFGGVNATIGTVLDRELHRRADGSIHSYASVTGGVSAEHLVDGNPAKSLEPLVPTVAIDSAVDVLANGRIPRERGELRFAVRADAARRLLSGQPTLLQGFDGKGHPQRIEVVPKTAPSSDIPLTLPIVDVAAFLERRSIALATGQSVPVALAPEQLRLLLLTGRADAQVGGTNVKLQSMAGAITSQSALTSTPAPQAGALPPPPPLNHGETPSGSIAAPTLATLQLAVYLCIQQDWELKGYSRGSLLHTVALAPQEELTLEVHSWEKENRGMEDTGTVEETTTLDLTNTQRDTTDVFGEIARTNELRNNGSGNLGYSGYGFTVGLKGGIDDGNSLNDTSRTTVSDFHEAVVKASSQLKATRQVKITEASETGRDNRVTRNIKNPNMCHTLAIDTFEVLAHYGVVTTIARAKTRPCVLVPIPLPFTFFDRALLREYETVLSSVLLQPSLKPGFAAAKLLAARDLACRVACEPCMCLDAKTALLGPEVGDALAKINLALPKLRSADPTNAFFWVDALLVPSGGSNSGITSFQPAAYADGLLKWMYGTVLEEEAPALYRLLIRPGTINTADTVTAARSILSALNGTSADKLGAFDLSRKWTLRLQEKIYRRYLAAGYGDPPGGKTAVVSQVAQWWRLVGDDAGLADAIKALVAAAKPASSADEDAKRKDLAKLYPIATVASAMEREEALLAHLNDHHDYYRGRVFLALPVGMQSDLLSSKGLRLPGINLRAVGREGAYLAYPLIVQSLSSKLQSYFARVISANTALDAVVGKDDVILPTGGIHLQTRLGECDACEPYVQQSRDADLRKRGADADISAAKALQEQAQAKRLERRLEATPANLDDPFAHALPTLNLSVQNVPTEAPPDG